jgi:hypothetical protein
MWDVAAAMGNEQAIRALSRWELAQGTNYRMASIFARAGIEWLANEREDFESMTLHARNLSLDNKKDEALPVVMDLCGMTAPGPPVPEGIKEADALPLPWKSWVNALSHEAMAQEWQLAWEYGARIWDDPEACAKYARSTGLRLGTHDWLKYATKGAMAGEMSLFQDLGKYYLALHGWFPKSLPVLNDVDSDIGFAWLEMSAEFEHLERAANIWAGMALVLREHDLRHRGMKYLRRGLEHITDRQDIGAADKEKAVTVLTSLIETWNVKDLVNMNEEKVTSMMFLGQPIIPVQL